ncbi:MAG: universal stress protein [Nitrospiraceae bacterium]
MHILLAVDQSAYANAVLAWMREFPHPSGTRLTISHVIEPFDVLDTLPGEPRSRVERRRADEAQAVLERATLVLRKRYRDIKCALRQGPAIYELLKLVRESQPDLIVTGTRGLGVAKGLVLGSVSQRLLSYAPCSVLLIPPQAKLKAPLTVLLATDGSRGAKAAAGIVAALPKIGRIGLVSVVPPVDQQEVRLYERETKQPAGLIKRQIQLARYDLAQRAMDATRGVLDGVKAEVRNKVLVGRPSDALPLEAKRQNSGLLVLGSRGLTGRLAEVLGSVSLTVAQRATCPVLVVKRPLS